MCTSLGIYSFQKCGNKSKIKWKSVKRHTKPPLLMSKILVSEQGVITYTSYQFNEIVRLEGKGIDI